MCCPWAFTHVGPSCTVAQVAAALTVQSWSLSAAPGMGNPAHGQHPEGGGGEWGAESVLRLDWAGPCLNHHGMPTFLGSNKWLNKTAREWAMASPPSFRTQAPSRPRHPELMRVPRSCPNALPWAVLYAAAPQATAANRHSPMAAGALAHTEHISIGPGQGWKGKDLRGGPSSG